MHNLIGGEIENMKTLYFDDFEDFSCAVADTYDALDCEDFEDVAIIAKYEEARQIIKELLCLGYEIHSIELNDPEFDGYDEEYIISLCNTGDDGDIWCEPMVREGNYITDESSIIYVLDNCSSEVLKHLDSECIFEVGIDDEYGCDECECACKKDEKPTTASSKSVYKVNGKEVSKEEYEKVLDKFSDKYMDSVQDILLNHLEFIDEMRNFAKLFNW